MPMDPWQNVAELLQHVRRNYVNKTHLNYFKNEEWHSLDTEVLLKEIKYITLGLVNLGIKRGDCIGLIASPSPRWTIVNFAIMLSGAILVPIFPNISEEHFLFEVQQTHTKTLFVCPDEHRDFQLHGDLYEHVIHLTSSSVDDTQLSYEILLDQGKALDAKNPGLYEQLERSINNEDLAAIIYTSGSTGEPKGVEHTHLSLVRHLFEKPIEFVGDKTRYLSILPLAHIFAYTMNIVIFAWGGSVYYWNDPKKIVPACQTVHPTVLVVVPRLLEKVYAQIIVKIQTSSFFQRNLALWAFNLAHNETNSLYKRLMHPVADLILYKKLRNYFGGNVETVISGGAALDPHLNYFYQEIGIPIVEGWGLTEACPVTVNRHDCNRIGTVGLPLKGLELDISPDGEALVRGSAVMHGYYLNPEETLHTIDAGGWLHTGDKGEIDADGFLTLHGRLKEMYKTSTGEYVAPIPIEHAICKTPFIDAAVVIAEGRKYASCLLFVNKEVLHNLKASQNQQEKSDDEFLKSEFIKEEMDKLFTRLNSHLNHWEQIHAYRFIAYPPSIEAGELTPSLKLRREVIMKKYKDLIDNMYAS
jgi:long-chain acyl-CoA synthetase